MVVFETFEEVYHVQVGVVTGAVGRCGNRDFPQIYSRLEDSEVLDWVKKVAFGDTFRPTEPSNLPLLPLPPRQTTKSNQGKCACICTIFISKCTYLYISTFKIGLLGKSLCKL